jgi:nitrate/nitrite transporter NarK
MKTKIAITGVIIIFLVFIIPFIANATSPDNASMYAKQVENSNQTYIMKDSYQWFVGTLYFFGFGALVIIWKNNIIAFINKEKKA